MSTREVNGADRALAGARSDRLRRHLAEAPFDALLVTSSEAVDYATGYRSVAGQLHRGLGLAALVTVRRTLLIAPAADAAPAIDAGIDPDDVVPYGRFYFAGDAPAATMSDRHRDYADAVHAAVRQLGPTTVGVEGMERSSGLIAAVQRAATVREADEWMLTIRAVKLPSEIALLRRAAQLAEDGITAALAIAKPGVSEQELAAAVAGAMVAGGGVPRFVVVTAGQRSALADAFPTSNTCRPGDLLRFDVGCQFAGYWSDIARTAVVGEPTSVQRSRYDALLAGLREELAVVRPGITAEDVFDAAVRTVQNHGLTPYRRHHAGHAIGLSVYERPVVGPQQRAVLTPGMVLCLETPYYQLGWGGMMVEDTGVVTDDGFELFTSIDRSLRAVPA